MPKSNAPLHKGFAHYLQTYGDVAPAHLKYCIRWIEAAYEHAGQSQDTLLDEEAESAYLWQIGKMYEKWQVKQAQHALSMYRHYLETEVANEDKANSSDTSSASKGEARQFDHVWREYAEKIREYLRLQQKSYRTEQTYLNWIRRFYSFVEGRDPRRLSAEEARQFLSHLSVKENVSSSTQNQALNALLYFYRNALDSDLGDIGKAVRAPKKERLPVVLSQQEVQQLLSHLEGEGYLMAALCYGAGLRLSESIRLRVQDIDLERGVLTVRGGKRDKDRQTVLPNELIGPLREHLKAVRAVYDQDRKDNVAGVHLPKALARKYKNANKEWEWFWLFPADQLSVDPRTKEVRRHHVAQVTFQRYVKKAAKAAGIPKRVTVHTLRHSFATHLVEKGYDIRTIQELLGHSDVRTTMVYTHIASRNALGIRSPLDE